MNSQDCDRIPFQATNRLGFKLIKHRDTRVISYTYREVCGELAEDKPSVKRFLEFADPDFTTVVSSKGGDIAFIRTGNKIDRVEAGVPTVPSR